MAQTNLISFPRVINFTIAATYIEAISRDLTAGDLIVDLESTEVINSSFIGLLIHIKDQLERNGCRLIVKMSPSIAETLRRLNLFDYFAENNTCKPLSSSTLSAIN